MPLLFANPGDEVKISGVNGNPQVKQHLNELGFNVGSLVTIVQKVKSGLIVKVKEARVALDSSLASKIIV
ncbi:MAG: FeoA family protein [Treponema succinifaciens]|uniref:FeoA family protein n=1 Tax=Treponema TaxID=157 RepID=UPI0023532D1E|nr:MULTISPECIES: FeoA family protein [Treponema]MDD6962216.1 FeoA family protein [Treponema succinifaciens]MDY5117076.1 FeoA family protein [Treponema succinifaciens]MDY5764177.1 FeoA family protein [Treponema sp.]UKI56386.1 MAG: ferrous iron transport protein A [Treponema succinifaciens]